MTFGDELRAALRANPDTRRKIGMDAGIDPAVLCRFLQGAWISEPTANALAKRLGVTIRKKHPRQR